MKGKRPGIKPMYTHLSCVNTAGALGWREWWRGDGGRVLFREKGYMFVELAAMWRMLRPAPLHIYANFSRGDETSANFLTLLPAIYFPLQTIRPAFKKSFQGCFFVAHPHPHTCLSCHTHYLPSCSVEITLTIPPTVKSAAHLLSTAAAQGGHMIHTTVTATSW